MSHKVVGSELRQCPKHGEYEAQQWALDPIPEPRSGVLAPFLAPFWGTCPRCDETLQLEADSRDEAIRGGMTERARLQAMRLREAGIPPRFANATVWNWQHPMEPQARVWGAVRDYLTHFEMAIESGRSVVLFGTPGTGKTHLAIGILRHVVEKNNTERYVTAMDLVASIRRSYDRNADASENEVVAQYTTPDLCVIDEVGRSTENQHDSAQLFRIMDVRYTNMKPTVLCSNLHREQMQRYLGASMMDRLREGGGLVLECSWGSSRSSKRKAPEEA